MGSFLGVEELYTLAQKPPNVAISSFEADPSSEIDSNSSSSNLLLYVPMVDGKVFLLKLLILSKSERAWWARQR